MMDERIEMSNKLVNAKYPSEHQSIIICNIWMLKKIDQERRMKGWVEQEQTEGKQCDIQLWSSGGVARDYKQRWRRRKQQRDG